jgi:glycosyltransferase involved in cell wall biosynthesis
MRIGIEANSYYKNTAGTGVYARAVVDHLKEKYRDHEIILYSNTRKSSMDLSRKSLLGRIGNGIYNIIWMQIILPVKLYREKIDVMFCPAYLAPLLAPCPVIVTIHDTAFVKYPETCDTLFKVYLKALLPLVIKRAKKILTVSVSAKEEIVGLLNAPENKVKSIYNGCGSKYRVINDDNRIREIKDRYGLPAHYILNVGTLEPRKNLEMLIEAYKEVKMQKGVEQKLVLTGSRGWYYENIMARINESGLQNDVIFSGFVAEEDMPCLYNGADLFVYPSLYEGFGIPVVEAMACGCPVITSNCSSLPEVAGDAAILVDPRDSSAIASAIWQALSDEKSRDVLRSKGIEQAKKFTWEKTVQEVWEGISETVRGN